MGSDLNLLANKKTNKLIRVAKNIKVKYPVRTQSAFG